MLFERILAAVGFDFRQVHEYLGLSHLHSLCSHRDALAAPDNNSIFSTDDHQWEGQFDRRYAKF